MRRRLATLVVAMSLALATVVGLTATAGAARGGRTFRIALSGANEVSPTNPHGNDDRGSVVLTINIGQREVCWRFGELTLTSGEALPFMGHIHEAPAGVAGGIVLTLFGMPANTPPTTTPAAPTSYPTGKVCVENVSRSLLVEIFQNPANYYVNLHNTTHPTGVVRGQLR